jgi:FkbM family methyltransferase
MEGSSVDPVRAHAFRWIASHRRNPLLRTAASLSERFLRAFGNVNYRLSTNGEERAVASLSHDVVRMAFDVGAYQGEWTTMVRRHHPHVLVHCFEVSPMVAEKLAMQFAGIDGIVVNQFGLGSGSGPRTLHVNDRFPDQTSLVERRDSDTRAVEVHMRSGDDYMREHAIERVDFVKVDAEGYDLEVLRGFSSSLADGRVAVVQFEYGEWNIRSRQLLIDFYELMEPWGYRIGKVRPGGVEFKLFQLGDEDFRGPACIAVHESRKDVLAALAGSYA